MYANAGPSAASSGAGEPPSGGAAVGEVGAFRLNSGIMPMSPRSARSDAAGTPAVATAGFVCNLCPVPWNLLRFPYRLHALAHEPMPNTHLRRAAGDDFAPP